MVESWNTLVPDHEVHKLKARLEAVFWNTSTFSFYFLRLTKEYDKLSKNLPEGITLRLPLESNIFTWEATLEGPKRSYYEGMNDYGILILEFTRVTVV